MGAKKEKFDLKVSRVDWFFSSLQKVIGRIIEKITIRRRAKLRIDILTGVVSRRKGGMKSRGR